MTTRGNVGGALLTIAITAALWAWSGGVASAQTCGGTGERRPPCPIVYMRRPPKDSRVTAASWRMTVPCPIGVVTNPARK